MEAMEAIEAIEAIITIAIREIRSLAAAAILLCAVCIGSVSAQTSDTVPVLLEFKWPIGLEATVEVSNLRERGTTKKDTVTSALAYRMKTRADPQGMVVAYDSFRIPVDAGSPSGMDVSAQLGVLLPNFVVSNSGEFVRVIGIEALRAMLDSMMAPALAKLAGNPEALQMVRSVLSEPALTAIAAQDWNAMVGIWIGGKLVKGQTLENESAEPVPVMPDVSLPMLYEYTLLDWVPCVEGEAAKRCVEVEMLSYPDPDAVKDFVTKLLSKAGAEAAGSVFETFEIENQVLLVTDPKNLLPYRVTIAKSVNGTGKEKGQPVSFSSFERKTYRFSYHRM